MNDIIQKLENVKTMPELDALRHETVKAMESGNKENFETIQNAFRKAKNRLRRIPLRERTW